MVGDIVKTCLEKKRYMKKKKKNEEPKRFRNSFIYRGFYLVNLVGNIIHTNSKKVSKSKKAPSKKLIAMKERHRPKLQRQIHMALQLRQRHLP